MEKNNYKLDDNFFDTNKTFEKFLEKMGKNFRRFPRIYKMGVLRRVTFLIRSRETNYDKSYSMLCETFNINQIKRHF